jgi:hypothetical protein
VIHYLKLSQSIDDHDEQVVIIDTACGVDGDSKVDGATSMPFGELVGTSLHERATICPTCYAIWLKDLGSPQVKFR